MKASHVLAFLIFALTPLAAFAANAWNERDLSWPASTTCINGADIAQCPILGYKIEAAGSCTATTWNLLATVGNVTSYHATNLKAGTYCFRGRAITSAGDSDPGPAAITSVTTVAAPVPIKAAPPGPVSVTQ